MATSDPQPLEEPRAAPPPTTVKELVDSGAVGSVVPPEYRIREQDHAAGADGAVEDEIPTVDLSLLRDGNDRQRKETIRELGRACEEWGFFMVNSRGLTDCDRSTAYCGEKLGQKRSRGCGIAAGRQPRGSDRDHRGDA